MARRCAYLTMDDISGFVSGSTRVRFRTSAGLGPNDVMAIDNVQIAASSAALTDFVDGVNGVSYAGSHGAGGFAAPWQEVNEADGAAAGDLRAIADQSNVRLRVQQANKSLRRSMDLSAFDVAWASVVYRRDSLEAGDRVELRVDDGGAPVTLESFAGPARQAHTRRQRAAVEPHWKA